MNLMWPYCSEMILLKGSLKMKKDANGLSESWTPLYYVVGLELTLVEELLDLLGIKKSIQVLEFC